MNSKIFKGKDETDLNRQKWDWQSANPRIKVLKTYPVEKLVPELSKVVTGSKLTAPDLVSMKVDFESPN